jgi:uncharacterized protein (TIRG00374 family)
LSLLSKLLVTAGLLTLVLTQLDLASLSQRLLAAHWGWLLVALGLTLAERLTQACKWRTLLGAKDNRPGWAWAGRVQLIATFYGSFLPSSLGVDAIRIIAAMRQGIAGVDATAATLADRAFMVMGQLLLATAAALLLSSQLPWLLRFAIWGAGLVTLLGGLMLCIAPLMRWMARWVRPVVGQRLSEKIGELYHAVHRYHRQPRVLAATAGLTVLVFVVRLAFGQALIWAVGLDLALWQLALVLPIVWLVKLLPVTVGAIGLQDGAYLVLLGLFGVGPAAAVSVSLLEHLLVRVAVLPGGLFWLVNRPAPAASSAAGAMAPPDSPDSDGTASLWYDPTTR